MDLDIDFLPRPGRPRTVPAQVTVVRPLREADLHLLSNPAVPAAVPLIKKLSDRHHSLARLISGGMQINQAARAAGMSVTRAGLLQKDPTFIELVEFYRSQATELIIDIQAQMLSMQIDTLQELRDRLEDDPEQFTHAMLLEIHTRMADRTGSGPMSRREFSGPGGGPIETRELPKKELARRLAYLLSENAQIIESPADG